MLNMDPVTRAAYDAAVTASARASAVFSRLTDPVSVKVYDGDGLEVGTGTMQTPWATIDRNVLRITNATSFLVTSSGTPDANWRIRFSSGPYWVDGSFGLEGSGQDFVWSLASWTATQTGRFTNSSMSVWQGQAQQDVSDTFNVPDGTSGSFGWYNTSTVNAGTYLQFVDATHDLKQYANLPAGSVPTFTIVSGTILGVNLNPSTGILTISSSTAPNNYSIIVRLTDTLGYSVNKGFTFQVQAAQVAPVWSTIPPITTAAGAQTNLAPYASDANGGTLTFSLVSGPGQVSTSGVYTMGATSGSIVVRVTDPTGLYADTSSIAVTVQVISSTGRTLYVNVAGGDDTRTYAQAQNSATPWATVGRAARGSTNWAAPNASQAAQAGDTVIVAAGIYWEDGYRGGGGSGNKESVGCNPANNGTVSAPITFRGVGLPQLRMQQNARGGVIGANARSHIVWDGFDIDDTYCGSGSDFGPVVLDVGAHHVTIQNCRIQGHNGSYYWGYPTFDGNYRLIAMEDVTYCTIRNNKISRALRGTLPGGANEAGVLSYDSAYNLIEQNTFSNCGGAIFIKGWHDADGSPEQVGNVIRRNLVTDTRDNGIRVLAARDTQVYQNIIVGGANDSGLLYAGFTTCENTIWQNNTVYGGNRGIFTLTGELINVRFRNNIIVNAQHAIYSYPSDNPAGGPVSWDRDLYYNNGWVFRTEGGNSQTTLAGWQGLSAALCDPNGSGANPLFVNAAGGNFRLQAGSPARTLGRDFYGIFGGNSTTVIPAGAYVTGNEQIGADW